MIGELPEPTPLLVVGFVALPIAMAALLVAGLAATSGRRAAARGGAAMVGWMALTGSLAAAGLLDAWAPPRMLLVLGGVLALLALAGRARWAERLGDLPLNLLVGVQAFRIAVELLIHEAVAEGVAHPTLTWTGTNFDIVPGVTALLLAPVAHRVGRRWLAAWNLASAGVLAVTVGTALLAMPTPLRCIGGDPPNVWVASFPFVWLPAVLVLSAWLGHVVLFRRLRR